jgi:hypothetical protein
MSQASQKNTSAVSAWLLTRMLRFERRSASAPPIGASNSCASPRPNTTSPTARFDEVSWNATTDCTTFEAKNPRNALSDPIHSSRKLGLRSALNT